MAEKDRIRKHQINIRLTETEYENAKQKAEYCGLSMSEFIRKQIMEGLIIKYERFDIKALTNELNKIGVNVNQIAKHINENGGEYDRQDMESLMNEFQKMQGEIYNALWGLE